MADLSGLNICDSDILRELERSEGDSDYGCVENESDDGEEDHIEEEIHLSDVEEIDDAIPVVSGLEGGIDTEEDLNLESSDEDDVPLAQLYFVKGPQKSILKWKKYPPQPKTIRTRSDNIVLRLPGPTRESRNADSEKECFNLFFGDDVIDMITINTNIYIEGIKVWFARERDAKLTNNVEMRAFIGILLLSGCFGSSRKSTSKIFDNSRGMGIECCYLAMSEKRFHFLMRCVRFDNINTRDERKQLDKLAPIRELFDLIVAKFRKMFTPSEYCTIDEQLVKFRGKCPFKMYIPKKPGRYGIKIFALACAKTMYTVNLEVYVGQQPEGPFKVSQSSLDVTLRLVAPIEKTNRNLTADNWFASVPLAEALLEDKGLTLVGTLRANRVGIPSELKADPDREVYSSMFAFHKKKTIVSYCPKKKKIVLLISTMHNDDKIDEESVEKRKPEIVTFYNRTKVGVDVVDQMCCKYDVTRNTKRWPMVIFYDLLNISCINAWRIFSANKVDHEIERSHFIEAVAWELIKPQIAERTNHPSIPAAIKRRGKEILGIEDEVQHERFPQDNKVGRCHLCGRARDQSTRKLCEKCGKKVCKGHMWVLCDSCANKE